MASHVTHVSGGQLCLGTFALQSYLAAAWADTCDSVGKTRNWLVILGASSPTMWGPPVMFVGLDSPQKLVRYKYHKP